MKPDATKDFNNIFYWGLFAVLTFFVGFRWDVGIDWELYYSLFGEYFYENERYAARTEIGNQYIKFALDYFNFTDAGYWLWVTGFITMYFFFYSIKKYSIAPFFSIALFIFLGTYFDLMNGVRQFLAISITMVAWKYLFEKRMIRYFLVIGLATLFHASALVMIPVYFLCNAKFNIKILKILAIIAVILSFNIIPIVGKIMNLFDRYEVYSDSKFAQAANDLSILRSVYPLLLLYITSLVYNKLMDKDRKTRVITNLSIMSIFITLLFPGITLMIRIGFYFQISFILFIPILCDTLSKKNGLIIKWFSVIYSMLFIYVTQLSRPVAKILPFQMNFYLFGGDLFWVLLTTLLLCMLIISMLNLGLKHNKQNQWKYL